MPFCARRPPTKHCCTKDTGSLQNNERGEKVVEINPNDEKCRNSPGSVSRYQPQSCHISLHARRCHQLCQIPLSYIEM